MALKFHFIDALCVCEGQRSLAFFFALAASACAQAQVQFWAANDQHSSAGAMAARQWADEGLMQPSRTEWAFAKSQLGAVKSSGALSWGATLARANYLRTNRNALTLAAQNELKSGVDLSPQGHFELEATSQTLTSTVLSMAWTQALNDAVSLTLRPHVHWVHDYQRSEGRLALRTTETQSRLQGNLFRVGTRHYGFLVDDRDHVGWGWGVDMRLHWAHELGAVQLDADNLMNQLRFSSFRFSNRQYDVNSSNGKDVVVSDIPSLQGTYGLSRGHEKLPVFWRLNFQPEFAQGLSMGWVGLGSDARWTLGMGRQWGQHGGWLRTVEAKNWSVGWDVSMGDGWSVGMGITGTRLDNPALTSLQVKGVW